ncbi:MAG: aminotransferase class III-fold pyridoxal phosphate-dependent enzyme, partial [Acidobacteria bacterium]|nr:aminotransferase class III-fold pyridoxal phosphate-dependent enzyme [Acidobacteriota bacterium]
RVAEKIVEMVPCAEQVCFANSGTEIVQMALRLARGVTGRGRFVKFEGHYHGWDDSVLVSYRSSPADLERAQPRPLATGKGQRPNPDGLIARWNHRESVEAVFASFGQEIAAVICEPLLCNSGCIAPEDGFLEFLRDITRRNGSLLIFDEVITGFRLAPGGAQDHYGVVPDLATFAKAIGGGLPLSCLAGKGDYMRLIADGQVVHAGTLNGNPIALAAAGATLDVLTRDAGEVYRRLWSSGERLRTGIEERLKAAGLPVVTSGGGPVFQIAFQARAPREYRDYTTADKALYSDFCLSLLDEGILLLPDGRWYLSTALTGEQIERTLDAVARVNSRPAIGPN